MILINSSPKAALKIFQPFLPIFVPVGIGSLLAITEREGIKAKFIDEQFEDDILGLVRQYIKGLEKPYIFGFSVLTVAFKNAILISRGLKKLYPDSIIIFGGIHPSAMPEEVLSYGHIDVVVRGEGEKSLIELYRCIKSGKDFTHLNNISYKRDGQIIHNKMELILEGLENYPAFPYHLFDPKRYDLGFILSSRGCPYECIFCSNRVTTGRRYRSRTAEAITHELNILSDKYNKKYILFLDDNLIVNRDRIYRIIADIKKKGLDKKMTFNFQARADSVDYKLLKDLYAAGFRSIFFGLETSSDRIMELIKKKETVAQCVEAVKMAKEIGFHINATFIYGLPTESHNDRMECVKLSRELEIDMVRYNNATPYPGTELYKIAKQENRLHIQGLYENFVSVSTLIENPFKKIPLSYLPHGNTEAEIRRDILFSFFSFYFDIRRLIRIFTRPQEGVGWFNSGEKFIDFVKKVPAVLVLIFMLGIKFCQLFYFMVIKKESAISLNKFLEVFEGLKIKKYNE